MKCSGLWLMAGCAIVVLSPTAGSAATEKLAPFVAKHCTACHDKDTAEGGLDLTALKIDLADAQNFDKWVLIHDRVQKGEMPPRASPRPARADRDAFITELSTDLIAADRARIATEGRATRRRMNRFEYEATLRDLLSLPMLEVREFLPEDTPAYGFNKVGDALDVSYLQVGRYLDAAEYALRQAMAVQTAPIEKTTNRYYAWDTRGFDQNGEPLIRKTFRMVGYDIIPRQRRGGGRGGQPPANTLPADRPRERPFEAPAADAQDRDKRSMVIVVGTYQPTEIRYNNFRAPVTGRYKLKFSAFTMWMSLDLQKASAGHGPEPLIIYSDRSPATFRTLGGMDVGIEPTVGEMDVQMIAGETIRPDCVRFARHRPPDHRNPHAEEDGMPGVAFQWMEVEGPIIEEWPPAGQKFLFGDMPTIDKGSVAVGEFAARRGARSFPGVDVVSKDPEGDADRLLRSFLAKVLRRPASEENVEQFRGVIRGAMKAGYNFTDSMIAGYTAVLSSPAFLYFDEQPGRLDDRALADRLSYFLWNSRPDDQLLSLAARNELHLPEVLRRETDRMLNDPRSSRFVNAFLDYWLDLRQIGASSPDTFMYPDYEYDDHLTELLVDETQRFFSEMLKRNLGVEHFVRSDFSYLNWRLGKHYGVPVDGVAMRRVELPPDGVRGGLLTQGSILKITANGTTTSPVTRGAWIMSRLMGQPPPPPPAAVPAVEPDIRGATTIREQLAQHRADATCNACHQNIDPVGFALESFDVLGGWRDYYRSMGEGEIVRGVGYNGQRYKFRRGPDVDPSGQLPDGRTFKNVLDLKQCLLRDQEQIARNLTQQLMIYATGAPIRFSDRSTVEQIVARTRADNYGVRSIVHEIVQSESFLNK